jgi:putative transposase
MIDSADSRLGISRQAELLEVNRTSFYRQGPVVSESEENLTLMGLVDKIHTVFPTWGYRKITAYIRSLGFIINRKRIRRLMRKMGAYAIYPGPNLSKLLHAKYRMPYLLRNLNIEEPDQVWGIDITYLRMQKGFMYLFVIIDWYSRSVVDFELSLTLEKTFVMNCLKRALSRRTPQIINSDQGSHFTNEEYITLLKNHGVRISMDGKGRATDNARTERFFRTLKYDCVYVNEFDSPRELRAAINEYMEVYNFQRPNQALNNQTPANIYFNSGIKAAA